MMQGYLYLHPDTVGVSLSTSPLGLAAYFLQILAAGIDTANRWSLAGVTEKVSNDISLKK